MIQFYFSHALHNINRQQGFPIAKLFLYDNQSCGWTKNCGPKLCQGMTQLLSRDLEYPNTCFLNTISWLSIVFLKTSFREPVYACTEFRSRSPCINIFSVYVITSNQICIFEHDRIYKQFPQCTSCLVPTNLCLIASNKKWFLYKSLYRNY